MSLHYAALGAQSWQAAVRDWLPRLSGERREAVERLRDPADRAASVAGYALLGRALDAVGRPYDPAQVARLPRAKPTLPGGPDFSIAHAGGLVACALAATAGAPLRVGLDLEPRASVRAAQLRVVLVAEEAAAIERRELDPTDAWVMKEAVLKAAGVGVGGAQRVRLRGESATLDGARYRLLRVEFAPAHAATHVAWLASDAPDCVLEVVEHRPEALLALPASR